MTEPRLMVAGIALVFVGVARTMEAMGAQNAILVCLTAAIIATVLMGVLSR